MKSQSSSSNKPWVGWDTQKKLRKMQHSMNFITRILFRICMIMTWFYVQESKYISGKEFLTHLFDARNKSSSWGRNNFFALIPSDHDSSHHHLLTHLTIKKYLMLWLLQVPPVTLVSIHSCIFSFSYSFFYDTHGNHPERNEMIPVDLTESSQKDRQVRQPCTGLLCDWQVTKKNKTEDAIIGRREIPYDYDYYDDSFALMLYHISFCDKRGVAYTHTHQEKVYVCISSFSILRRQRW